MSQNHVTDAVVEATHIVTKIIGSLAPNARSLHTSKSWRQERICIRALAADRLDSNKMDFNWNNAGKLNFDNQNEVSKKEPFYIMYSLNVMELFSTPITLVLNQGKLHLELKSTLYLELKSTPFRVEINTKMGLNLPPLHL